MTLENTDTTLVKVSPNNDTEVQAFYTESLRLKDYAHTRAIVNAGDLAGATDDLSIIAKVVKGLEAKRKDYLAPFQNHVKEINEAFKSLAQPIEEANQITRQKVGAFHQQQELRRKEQEEINRKRMEAAQAEAKLNNGEISEPVNLVEVTPEVSHVETSMGSTSMRDNWKYTITDLAQVPREYLVVDTAMLTSIAKKQHDNKQIPGIRFYNEPIVQVNTR